MTEYPRQPSRRFEAFGAGRRTPSHERWLVSYADFITLLFAFFATMYAISSVDAMKLTKVAHALQVAFDDSARGRSLAAGSGMMPERGSRLVPGVETGLDMRAVVTRDLDEEIKAHHLDVAADRRGVVLSIPEAGLFAQGSDELSPIALPLIARVAATVARLPNAVRVEGHTDDLPIHTARFRSNWDLSTARAASVIEVLIERGIEPRRLVAAGYGEFRPRVPNMSPVARAQNRRVDVVILNDVTVIAEEAEIPR
jgi:chemotaxis protein MotB